MIRSGILEITDKQSVVLLSAIAMAMDLQEDAAPTDRHALAMEVRSKHLERVRSGLYDDSGQKNPCMITENYGAEYHVDLDCTRLALPLPILKIFHPVLCYDANICA